MKNEKEHLLKQLTQLRNSYIDINCLMRDESITREEFDLLNKTLKTLDNIYDRTYSKIDNKLLTTNKCCFRCNNDVLISDNINYSYQCLECNENLYEFEVSEKYSIKNSDSFSNSFDLELYYSSDKNKLYIGTESSSGCEYDCTNINEFIDSIKDYYCSYLEKIDEEMEEELC